MFGSKCRLDIVEAGNLGSVLHLAPWDGLLVFARTIVVHVLALELTVGIRDRVQVAELFLEGTHFPLRFDIFGVLLVAVLLFNFSVHIVLGHHKFSRGALVSEEVAELALELNRVIKLLRGLRAFQVEPEQGIHNAAISENFVLHGLLHQAVHVVFL